MSDLFASGRIVDLILLFVALEAIGLRLRGAPRGLGSLDIAAALLPGVALMLALRAALTGAWWGWIAAWLAAALAAHALDLWRRWPTLATGAAKP